MSIFGFKTFSAYWDRQFVLVLPCTIMLILWQLQCWIKSPMFYHVLLIAWKLLCHFALVLLWVTTRTSHRTAPRLTPLHGTDHDNIVVPRTLLWYSTAVNYCNNTFEMYAEKRKYITNLDVRHWTFIWPTI